MTGLFVWFAANEQDRTLQYAGLALYVIAAMIWHIDGIRWMKARAEVVDLDELLKLKRDEERKRRGRR